MTPNTGTFHLPPRASSQKIQARLFATHHVFHRCAQGSECLCISCNFEPGSCSLLNRSKHEPRKDWCMATVLFPRCHRPRKTNVGLNTAWAGVVGQWEGYQGAVSGPGIHPLPFPFPLLPTLGQKYGGSTRMNSSGSKRPTSVPGEVLRQVAHPCPWPGPWHP